MNDLTLAMTAASSAPSFCSFGEAARLRLLLPPVMTVQGTGLPVGPSDGPAAAPAPFMRTGLPFFTTGNGAHVGVYGAARVTNAAVGDVKGVDQVQLEATAVRIAVDKWDPPRRTPVRC